MKLTSILVAVDFSEPSQRALEAAIAMAKKLGGRIHLLHSYHVPIPGPMPDLIYFPPDTWTPVREASAKRMQEMIDRLRAEGIEGHLHLGPGYAVGAILETAKEVHADLIVLGTRGLTGLPHVLLGSIAERVVRAAPCPVLTVH